MVTAERIHNGLRLPAIRREAKQTVLELAPEACLPRGYSLRADMVLIRDEDGAALGTMASIDFACRHAATLARMAALQAAQREEPA